jgi:hypothetical protein
VVNLTNPMLMKGPIREVISIGPHRVTIRLPANLRVTTVRLLTAATTPQVEDRDGTVTVTVPSIGVHEVIALDLSQ